MSNLNTRTGVGDRAPGRILRILTWNLNPTSPVHVETQRQSEAEIKHGPRREETRKNHRPA